MFKVTVFSRWNESDEWEEDEVFSKSETLDGALEELNKAHAYYIQTGSYDVDEIYINKEEQEYSFDLEDYERDMPDKLVKIVIED
jgi:hypothetical protein